MLFNLPPKAEKRSTHFSCIARMYFPSEVLRSGATRGREDGCPSTSCSIRTSLLMTVTQEGKPITEAHLQILSASLTCHLISTYPVGPTKSTELKKGQGAGNYTVPVGKTLKVTGGLGRN
jgi:hypothetical protein